MPDSCHVLMCVELSPHAVRRFAPQKLLDVTKLTETGWTAQISLSEGLERTVAWYREHVGTLR